MSEKELITAANFVKSSADWRECPKDKYPDIAFIGRSNVGKSSLINMLTNRKKLAKISSKPGKTRLINHFLIDESWHLVDLPGYGWAKVSKVEKAKWEKMIHNYLLKRESLTIVFVLVDSRHEPINSDVEMINWLGENGIPLGIVFTKSDKSGKGKVSRNVDLFKKTLEPIWEHLPPHFVTSAETKSGRAELLSYIVNSCVRTQ